MKKVFLFFLAFLCLFCSLFSQNAVSQDELHDDLNADFQNVLQNDSQNEFKDDFAQDEWSLDDSTEENADKTVHDDSENAGSENAIGDTLQQYQTFSWKMVAKAKKYEIVVDKKLDDDTWVNAATEQTTENGMELLLYPGNYRVAVSVFNVLGKKTSTTDWTSFIILNETQPYLYADSLKKSEAWQSPLLILKQEGSTTVEETDDEGSVVAREGDPTNSIFLKGKNIFFPTTTFTLVPKNNTDEGKPFEAFVDLREEVPLKIVRRDTENNGVVVAYEPALLFSGYYDLVVKNPGGDSAKLELLVFSDEAPKIDSSDFAYNENYKVNTVKIDKDGEAIFYVKGTGFGNNTTFSFTAEDGFIRYPFESGYSRSDIQLSLASHKCLDKNGTIQLTFKLPSYQLYSGYYRFTANNAGIGSDSLLLLVQAESQIDLAPEIEKIKTKVSKGEDLLSYEVNGQNIDSNTVFTLISAYSEEEDANSRFEINYVTSKKKGKLHFLSGTSKGIIPGKYALLAENGGASKIYYVDIDKKQSFELTDLSSSESEKLFLRPSAKENVTQVTLEECFELNTIDAKYKARLPVFMSSFGMYGGLVNDFKSSKDLEAQFQINVLNFNWLRFAAGAKIFDFNTWGTKGIHYGGDIFLEIPGEMFRPYVGAGFYNESFQLTGFKVTGTSFVRYYSVPLYVGFKFVNFMDFRYILSLENVQKPIENWFATNIIALGVNIPLSRYRYKIIPTELEARIAANEMLDGTNYKIKKKVTALDLDSPVVTGFNNNKNIKKVYIGSHVNEIGIKAFSDCENIEEIVLGSNLQVISQKAFENTTKISEITIPESVKTIEEDAFKGWSSGQKITVGWSSDDETTRNIPGLLGIAPNVYYSDGVKLNKSTDSLSAFYNEETWQKLGEKPILKIQNSFIKDKKNNNFNSVLFDGTILVADGKYRPTNVMINKNEFPSVSYEASEKKLRGITFNAVLDGNVKVSLVLYDSDKNVLSSTKLNLKQRKENIIEYSVPINVKAKNIDSIGFEISPDVKYDNQMIIYKLNVYNVAIEN